MRLIVFVFRSDFHYLGHRLTQKGKLMIRLLFASLSFLPYIVGASDTFEYFSSTDKSFSAYVLDCEDSVILLDYHELYNVESQYKYAVNATNKKERIEELLKRSKLLSDPKSKLFRDWLNNFENEVKFLRGINFGPLNDEFDFIVQEGCEIKTLFKAISPKNKGKSLFIELELWEKLDEVSQVGAIFNYLINLDYIYLHQKTNTIYSRFLNAFIASNRVGELAGFNLRSNLFKKLGYSFLYYDNHFYALKDSTNYEFPFLVSSEGDLTHAHFESVPFYLQKFGYRNEIKIQNINGLKFSLPLNMNFFVRENNQVRFRDVQLLSVCIGKFRVKPPLRIMAIDLIYKKGEFHFKSLYTNNLTLKGKDIRNLEFKNGEVIISPEQRGSSVSSDTQELGECTN